MKTEKIMNIFKSRSFVVPLYVFQLREKFSLPFEEFLFLIYLSNIKEQFVFDPSKLSNEFGISLNDVKVQDTGYVLSEDDFKVRSVQRDYARYEKTEAHIFYRTYRSRKNDHYCKAGIQIYGG